MHQVFGARAGFTHLLTLTLATATALGFSGCLFDNGPIDNRRCSSDEDCEAGQACRENFCAVVGEGDACTTDAQCDDGQFCNGAETCDPGNGAADDQGCVAGASPQVDDGIACTVDACDEQGDQILNTPGPSCQCANGTDIECDIRLAAELGVDVEDELPNLCIQATCDDQLQCQRVNRPAGQSCDDGVACTDGDTCDGEGACVGSADDALCDDGAFCNGAETCAPEAPNANGRGCLAGDAPEVDDNDECTADSCNEARDEIVHVDICQCEVDADCVPEQNANSCLRYFCDGGTCDQEPQPRNTVCNDGVACTDGDTCNGAGICGGTPINALCDDGAFCNGAETCDPDNGAADAEGCVTGTAPEVDDNDQCTDDSCDEVNDTIVHESNGQCECVVDADCVPEVPDLCLVYTCGRNRTCLQNAAPNGTACDDGVACTDDVCSQGICVGSVNDGNCDDGRFCNGAEVCDLELGCLPGEPPQVNDGDDCTADSCDEVNDTILHDDICGCVVDGDCQQGEVCVEGTCQPDGACAIDADCVPEQDANDCLRYFCDAGACAQEPQPGGATCDDGVACTGSDVCDGQGSCSGTPDDGQCDNGLFCDGAETCAPGDQGANLDGCVTGTAPALDDNDECTADACDEVNDRVVHNNICDCVEDADCEPVNGDACVRHFCLAGTCGQEPQAEGTLCEDGVACTGGDACDGQGACAGTPDDGQCDNGLFCDGAETCAPGDQGANLDGCVAGAAPVLDDGVACTDDSCDEANDAILHTPDDGACDDGAFCNGAETCDAVNDCQDGTAPVVDDNDECTADSCDEANDTILHDNICECVVDADCAPDVPVACQTSACVQGACVDSDAPDGAACAQQCNNAQVDGACFAGACVLPPEGSTGQGTCDDGIDNDCDEATDGADSGCRTPDLLEISAPGTGVVGLGAEGAVLEITPRDGGQPVTDQDPNLYCVSRIVDHEEEFDDDLQAVLGRGKVSFLDANGDPSQDPSGSVTSGVAFGGQRALELCDGFSVLMDNIDMPTIGNPDQVYTYHLTVTLGSAAGQLGLNDFLVVSYRNNTTAGKFVPLAARTSIDPEGLETFQFVLFNRNDLSPLDVRVDLFNALGLPTTACGFVEEIRLERTPLINPDFRIDRAYPQWAFGSRVENARNDFNPSLNLTNFFRRESIGGGTHVVESTNRANNNQNNGIEWAFNGGFFGALLLPSVEVLPSNDDRANPLVLDFRATSEDTTYLPSELGQAGFVIGEDLTTVTKVATIFPRTGGPDHLISHYDLGNVSGFNRYVVALPEEAKPLFNRDFGLLSGALVGASKRLWLDDVNLYVHTLPATIDVGVEVLGAAEPGSPVHQIRLRHAEPGQARVQCFWQIPSDPDTITVASEPARITFE